MFVKNKSKVDFHYRKGTYLALLKAQTVSYVDETKVTAKELLDCYGQRIDIISRDIVVAVPSEPTPLGKKVEAPKKIKTLKKVETVEKTALNDSFIEEILKEVETEVAKNETPVTNADTDVDTDTEKKEKEVKVTKVKATKATKAKTSRRKKATSKKS